MSLNAVAPRQRSVLGTAMAILLLLVALAAVLALAATRIAEQRISSMLGPRSQVGDVSVGFKRVVLTDVVVPGGEGQAGARAQRVVLEPEWSSFLRHEAVFKTITIEGFDFAVVRTAGGDMQIAPALQAALRAGDGGDAKSRRDRPVQVGELVLRNGRLDYLDAVVSKPPHRIPFKDVQARLSPVTVPGDGAHSDMEFSGAVEDNRNGAATVRAQGWVELGGTDADMKVAVRNMDIQHAAPYLAENGAGSLAGGAMDLDMTTAIANRDLRASGTVALRGLKFSGDGTLFSFPRKAVLAAMKDSSGTVRFEFALRGSLDNPKFSVTRGFAAQVARGFGRAIGVGAEGAAEGVAGAVKELGNALSDLLSP
ncbi:DUF748 domain-containing protein [Achromobacter seleniivolatilans]|uniref:DUF748 domain-containing protein n=1 Tax=Achromobacter seleniivolatilans TaxID=3047478 RepID=A0ABY9M5D4_9BURK|nr:DUF748 domain-containing protein [Achromobacter sp. R39]WMD22030.1 DUF748 domain-containing protein [Achromobacter sp. R39]